MSRRRRRLSATARTVGQSLIAGAAGTAAMTVSSTIEMRLRGRAASSAPADAATKVLGIERFAGEPARARFGTLVHWGYGTGWGAGRGLARAAGRGPRSATALHLLALWSSEQVMLPSLGVAPPLTRWGAREIAIDAWHHAVYATTCGLAYELIERDAAAPR
jgi:hypothetical protein